VSSVTFLPLADDDLLAAWLRIAQDNPLAADDYVDHVQQVCVLIAENPGMGVDRDDIKAVVRSFPVQKHVIFCAPIDQGIVVLRVWPTAQNPVRFML